MSAEVITARGGETKVSTVVDLIQEWVLPGPIPRAKRRAKRRLRAEWPALAGALDLMTAVVLLDPEPTP